MKKIFSGVGVALVTPFLDGVVDYDSLGRLIEEVVSNGVSAIIILGTTGENVAVGEEERREIIEFSKEKIAGRTKLIVGTGSNNFDIAKQNTIMAKSLGADACLVVTPYYNKTSQAGLINYYNELAKIQLPIIMYNVPSRTGLNIDTETVRELIKNPYIVGLKESTTDIKRIIVLMSICKDKIAIYSGEDALNYVFYTLGADGCISVTANAYTKKVKSVFDLVKTKNYEQAISEQEKLQRINEVLFCETNPIPIKYVLYKQGKISSNKTRLPLVEPSDSHKREIDTAMEEYENLNKI